MASTAATQCAASAVSAALISRRAVVLAALASAPVAQALASRSLQFPRDFGSHPELRTEWWYITGHARSGVREFGFQVTFFRSRVDETQAMRSAFAAKQLIFAHAAVSDLEGRRLHHEQRIARAGFGIAQASPDETDVHLRDWSLRRSGGVYRAQAPAGAFSLDLRCAPTQPVLLHGNSVLSTKGPEPGQVSYYYSEPQLATQGRLLLQGRAFDVAGTAWLDHEWSEAPMHRDAVGWDWIGMNLADGSALMAFRLRRSDGSALWSGGSFRRAGGVPQGFDADQVVFEPVRRWQSPTSRATYPVEWSVHTPAGSFVVRALLDDQELDSRSSTGAIYWEGVSDLNDAQGRRVGRGYLEMTGYAAPLRI